MIWELKMPRLDEDMKAGTVTGWKKKEGDLVQKGEPLADIETQKVTVELEAPGSGVLRIILAGDGELVPINSLMAVIADPEDDISAFQNVRADNKREKNEPSARAVSSKEIASPIAATAPGEGERVLVSPLARKLAEERGLDLSTVRGTGPGGRITKEDILNHQPEEPRSRAAAGRRRIAKILPLVGMRKTIADRMRESWQRSPRAEHFLTVDMTDLMNSYQKYGEIWENRYAVRPSVNDVIIAAAARTLRMFPMVNASLLGDQIEVYEDINVSVAVAVENGLVTPVLCQADRLDLFAVARETRRLVELVRRKEHTAETLAGSTFTITNLGMFDIDFFVPIINPAESAILAVGKIQKKPLVIQNAIVIRSVMMLCLAYDHRVLDGAVVARFLQAIKQRLENPDSLLPQGE